MGTDVRFVVDQFALCNRFASLGVTNPDNTLLPQAYGRVQTAYLKQNRKESFAVQYAEENKSYTFPESLRVLQAAYLRVNLPANNSGSYKTCPGLNIIKTIHIRCNSLRDESARAYAAAHLGYKSGAASGAARVCWLPIPLPNSSIWRYGGRSQGALPFGSFKNNKIEVTFDMYDNTYSAADRTAPSPALSGGQIVMKEVVAPLSQMPVLSDARGRYSVVSRRFTILQEADIVVSNLSGCVTEIIVEAFAYDANQDRLDVRAPVVPTEVKLICDSVECIKYDTQDECRLVDYSHGYRRNDFFDGNVYRLVFGSHGADTDRQFCGAMNFQGITQANLKLKFAQQVTFRVLAVQLGVTSITSSGRLVQKLD